MRISLGSFEIFIFYLIIAIIVFYCLKIYSQSDVFNLKCIISTKDGIKYCVRDRENIKEAVFLLEEVVGRCKKMVYLLYKKYPDDKRVIQLHKNFNPKRFSETLPSSELTAYSQDKGAKVAMCLNKTKNDNSNLIDIETLTFVALHELTHIMTTSVGHQQDFWQNFKFVLINAKEFGIYDPIDYKNKPQEYCGMTIEDNPYYNL